MKRFIKLLVLGSVVAGVYQVLRRAPQHTNLGGGVEGRVGAGAPRDVVGANIEDAVLLATEAGIADVDPQPLSHVAGEGIDLDADVQAQTSVRDQRERLRKTPR